MTVGNLDKTQESLVISFCDGDIRIPLNISDLFAIERLDPTFSEQINNWLIFRRESKKRRDEAKTATSALATSYGSRYGRGRFGHRREYVLESSDDTNDMEALTDLNDKSLSLTRPENEVFVGMGELMQTITAATESRVTWGLVIANIRRIAWTLTETQVEVLQRRLHAIHKGLKPGDLGYLETVNICEHLSYVADKIWEGV